MDHWPLLTESIETVSDPVAIYVIENNTIILECMINSLITNASNTVKPIRKESTEKKIVVLNDWPLTPFDHPNADQYYPVRVVRQMLV